MKALPPKYLRVFTLIVLAFGLFGAMRTVELYAEEPRRGVVALEMELSGEYIVPKIHGENYYNKPPLFNWLIVGASKVTGSMDETAVRLPSLIAFVLLAFLIFYFGKKYISEQVGWIAALAWLANPDILFFSSTISGEIDLFFSLLVVAQAFVLFHFLEKEKHFQAFVLSYAIASVGILTKGLPALVFQAFTILAWVLINKKWKWLFSWQHISGVIVFLIPLVAYFYAYNQRTPVLPFLVNLFMESSQRTAVEMDAMRTAKSFVQFPFLILGMLLPFSLVLFFLFKKFKSLGREIQSNRLLYFCLVFVVANLWIYWISPGVEKRYLYPFFPFIYLLLSFALVWLFNARAERVWWMFALLALIRVVFNYTVLPQRDASDTRVYRENMKELTEKFQEPIVLLSRIELDVNRVLHYSDTIKTYAHIPYAIPYYYSLYSGRVMSITDHAEPGALYISRDNLPEAPIDTLHTFTRKGHAPWVVFRLTPSE
jgi:4-amino-4-deoxy-L-arabinose transferase-like glycosyltransferase